jgi:hypothetical protein
VYFYDKVFEHSPLPPPPLTLTLIDKKTIIRYEKLRYIGMGLRTEKSFSRYFQLHFMQKRKKKERKKEKKVAEMY